MISSEMGCKILDAHPKRTKRQEIYLCRHCPYPDCISPTKENDLKEKYHPPEIREVYLRCKHCGATETLEMRDGKLQKSGKWLQKGDIIWHQNICGEGEEIKFRT